MANYKRALQLLIHIRFYPSRTESQKVNLTFIYISPNLVNITSKWHYFWLFYSTWVNTIRMILNKTDSKYRIEMMIIQWWWWLYLWGRTTCWSCRRSNLIVTDLSFVCINVRWIVSFAVPQGNIGLGLSFLEIQWFVQIFIDKMILRTFLTTDIAAGWHAD